MELKESNSCCGIAELGSFNYDDDDDPVTPVGIKAQLIEARIEDYGKEIVEFVKPAPAK